MRTSKVLRRGVATLLALVIGLGLMTGVAAAANGDKDGSKTGTDIVNLVPSGKQEPGAKPSLSDVASFSEASA